MARFSFLPGEVRFYDYFEKATANLVEGARQLQHLLDHCSERDDVEQQVAQITETEHRGDFIVHEVTELLPRTLITPIDTDDIQRLIFSVDDALDSIEECASRLLIYQICEGTEPAKRLARLVTEGSLELEAAMKGLRDKARYKEAQDHVVKINTVENNGDRVLRDALSELVANRQDLFNLIRWKEVYEDLEQTTDRLEDAGDVIMKVIIANA